MRFNVFVYVVAILFSSEAFSNVCSGYGPQTPRDITQKSGLNSVKFRFAPSYKEMNLCNIHFHKNAEHKGPEFSVYAGKGKFGGYKCNDSDKLSKKELAPVGKVSCKNIKPGDTIEIHWVHTTCDIKPGKGLGACLSPACANPQLRVETQVYTLVNDKDAKNLGLMGADRKVNGYYQAKSIPTGLDAVEFLGSTTGPSYTEEKCSPLQVTWNVSPSCQKMDINSVHKWCENNVFQENKAHGVRELVKNKKLLSEIK
ncbi:delta-class carbonic anhydrase [Bacteriovoracaceae bacterium]|nr:delta-class carbonic anhydrase [Bacteriovoracaceae bacterium]